MTELTAHCAFCILFINTVHSSLKSIQLQHSKYENYYFGHSKVFFNKLPPNAPSQLFKIAYHGWRTITHSHPCHITNSTTYAMRLTSLIYSTPETNTAQTNITTYESFEILHQYSRAFCSLVMLHCIIG